MNLKFSGYDLIEIIDEIKMDIIIFNRFTDPFYPKLGLDTLPDFVPTEHYKQLMYFCKEALELFKAKKDCCFKLSEIKFVIEEYAELFDETEIWIKLYSNFEPFTLSYLEFCEMRVFIEEYSKDCEKALNEANQLKTTDWMEKYETIYQHIQQTIDFNTKEFMNESIYVPLIDSKFLIPRQEVLVHWEFSKCFTEAKTNLN